MTTDVLYQKDPALGLLGIKMQTVKPGQAVMTMQVTKQMHNAFGICHGGFIYTLADAAFSYACNSYDYDAVAQHCSIDYIRPGKTDSILTAVAEEQCISGRTGFYDIKVYNDDNEIVALFKGNSFRIS